MNFKWWQWILIIITAGIVFYTVYPKYYFVKKKNYYGTEEIYKCNKFTGTAEYAPGTPGIVVGTDTVETPAESTTTVAPASF